MGCSWIGFCGLDPQAQAAWAQAILSVLAILAAGWFPFIHQRIKSRERMKGLAAAASVAADEAHHVCGAIATARGHNGSVPESDIIPWEAVVGEWERLPLIEFPEDAVVYSMLTIKSCSVVLLRKAREQRHTDGLEAPQYTRFGSSTDEAIGSLRNQIESAADDIVRVQREHWVIVPVRPMRNFYQRARSWLRRKAGRAKV